jgi:hypothetical protein
MNAELRFYSFVLVGGAGLLLAAAAWSRGRRKTPDQLEQERRMHINEVGRITDGTVIDVNEMQTGGSDELQLLIYHYDVAGVSYEASQDVSCLRHMVDLHSCRSGLMTSIKYDPSNPGNSIVISEKWTGLRL